MTYGEAIMVTILETSYRLRRDPGRYGVEAVEPVAIRLMPEELLALVKHLQAIHAMLWAPVDLTKRLEGETGLRVAGLAVLEVHKPPSLAERYVLRERV